MTVERCHRWAAGRWERRDRVNRVSSSIPPSLLPSFLSHFAHARIRYVNSALQRLFNGSRLTREWKKKKKKKRFTRLLLPVSFPFPASKADARRFPSFLPFSFIFSIRLDSTRLDSASLSRRNCTRGDIFDYPAGIRAYLDCYQNFAQPAFTSFPFKPGSRVPNVFPLRFSRFLFFFSKTFSFRWILCISYPSFLFSDICYFSKRVEGGGRKR